MSLIHDGTSAQHLFIQELEAVLAKEHLRISDDARAHLISLLSELRLVDHLDVSRPLAPELLEAMGDVPSAIRGPLLEGVGNTCLLLCGLWWQSVEYAKQYKGGEDLSYHREVGTRAFRMLDREPYRELAENFVGIEHAIALMGSRLQLHDTDHRQILRLYEYFLRSRNEVARKILLAKGIILRNDEKMS